MRLCRDDVRSLLLAGLLVWLTNVALAAEVPGQPTAAVAPVKYDQNEALRKSQSAVGTQVGDYTLFDRQGKPVRLSDYRGKPLLVSFIYTSCAEVCPTTTQHLAKAVKYMQAALGPDSFSVVTVGFNAPWDSPQAMRDFAERQKIGLPNWEFLSADPATMQRFVRELGFSYAYSVTGFDHISQLTMIDQSGRIDSQIYGDTFELPRMGEPLKKLVGNVQTQYPGWEGISNRIRLFCTVFDPKTGEYKTDYSLFVGTFISIFLIYFCFAWAFREWRRSGQRGAPRVN